MAKLVPFAKIGVVIFLSLMIFTRFYNLPATSRYLHDDARNLRDMHRIYKDRDITLVGPINGDLVIVYPSLSFYMFLPFAALGNFEPHAPVYGAAFYGVLTVLFILYLVKKVNRGQLLLMTVLSIVWFPLIDSSRIPWNPHLVPFMQVLALLAYFGKRPFWLLLAGFLFGLTFHLHYFAIVSFGTFFALDVFLNIRKRNFAKSFFLGLGFVASILPFVFFDLKNPPGLFFGKFLHSNLVNENAGGEFSNLLPSILGNIWNTLLLLGGNRIFAFGLGLIFLFVFLKDVQRKRKSLLFFFPVLAQVAAISFLPEFFNRYFYLSIAFFIVWLVYKRTAVEGLLIKLSFAVMVFASLSPLALYLTKPVREPSPLTASYVTNWIKEQVTLDDRKNVNVGVLASPDPDPLGEIYRNTLEVKGIQTKLPNEYDITDNLFIVSTSSEEIVRRDASNIMHGFRKGPLARAYEVPDSDWRVYLFNRDPKLP